MPQKKTKKSPTKPAARPSNGIAPDHALRAAIDMPSMEKHQERLNALSVAVNEVLRAHGFLGADDDKVCEWVTVVRPNGTVYVERRCNPTKT